MTLSLDGFSGSLTPGDGSIETTASLAKELLYAGYSVRLDGTPVRLEYGPGIDYVYWAAGQATDTPVIPTARPDW